MAMSTFFGERTALEVFESECDNAHNAWFDAQSDVRDARRVMCEAEEVLAAARVTLSEARQAASKAKAALNEAEGNLAAEKLRRFGDYEEE
jgi:multidrug resistance efflux pump